MTNLEEALGEIDVLAPAERADAAPRKSALDDKINEHFAGAVVRKDLVKAVRGNAVVPSYVLEYLLGQYAASDDEETIKAGSEAVRRIFAQHYVHRNEAEWVKPIIGRHRWYRMRLLSRSVPKRRKSRLTQVDASHLSPSFHEA